MISMGRFTEFINEFINMYNEEQEDKTIWELWLHRVFDKSYEDFRMALNPKQNKAAPTKEDITSTVCASKDILNSFRPSKG